MWIGLVVFAVGLGWSTVYRAAFSPAHRTDFTVYTAAAQAVLDRTNIYDAQNVRGWLYMYLPVFAVVMVPFALLIGAWPAGAAGMALAAGLWYLLSVAMLAHLIWLSARLAKRFWPDTKYNLTQLSMLALLGVLWPAMSGLARGQASVLIGYLVILGVWAMIAACRWLAGGAMAGAVVLKVFPALFFPYWLFTRRWMLLTTATIWMVLLVFVFPGFALGWQRNIDFLKQWVSDVALPANKSSESETDQRYAQMIDPRLSRNQSLHGVMIRYLAPQNIPESAGREKLATRIGLVLRLLVLGITAWACTRAIGGGRAGRGDRAAMLLHACALILCMLLVSPVSWLHSYVLLALPLAVAAAIAGTDPQSRASKFFGRAYIAYLILLLIGLAEPIRLLGSPMWGAAVLWGSCMWMLTSRRAVAS